MHIVKHTIASMGGNKSTVNLLLLALGLGCLLTLMSVRTTGRINMMDRDRSLADVPLLLTEEIVSNVKRDDTQSLSYQQVPVTATGEDMPSYQKTIESRTPERPTSETQTPDRSALVLKSIPSTEKRDKPQSVSGRQAPITSPGVGTADSQITTNRTAPQESAPETQTSDKTPIETSSTVDLGPPEPLPEVPQAHPEPTGNENQTNLQKTNDIRANMTMVNGTKSLGDTTTPTTVQVDPTWPPPMGHIADSQKRIILLIVNCGYIDMADNLIQSLLNVNVTNFVLIPLDSMTYTTLRKIYPERVVPLMPGLEQITETATYGSEAFKALTASRANIVHQFLEQGYTIFYCDLDMVWRKNALEYVAKLTDVNEYELVVVNDHNRHTVCSCFLYMKPTLNNLELLEMWDAEIRTGAHEQDQPAFQAALKAKTEHRGDKRELKYLKIAADSAFIPSGKMFFRLWNDTAKEEVVIVHNNYIRGYETKVERFANFSLWNPTGNLEKVSYSCKNVMTRRLESCSAWLNQVGKRRVRRS